MGFSEEDYEKCRVAVEDKDVEIYNRAGNTIVVDVIVALYEELKEQYPEHFTNDLELISLFSGIGAFESAFRHIEE